MLSLFPEEQNRKLEDIPVEEGRYKSFGNTKHQNRKR